MMQGFEALRALEELVEAGHCSTVQTPALEAAGWRWRAAEAGGDVEGAGVAAALSDAAVRRAEVGELVELGLTGEELVGMVKRIERRICGLELVAA